MSVSTANPVVSDGYAWNARTYERQEPRSDSRVWCLKKAPFLEEMPAGIGFLQSLQLDMPEGTIKSLCLVGPIV